MKKRSVSLNYIYNLCYQIFLIIVPLITTPYVSRVLTSSGVGQYSFCNSISNYFILFGSLGFNIYAQREIARHQDDKYLQSKIFFEIFFARFFTVSITLAIHLVILFCGLYNEYTQLMAIFSINIIATIFDISFFYQGNEEFGFVSLVNVVIRTICTILIFVFVKNSSDVRIYVLCLSMMLIGSNVFLFIKLPKMLVKIRFSELNIKKHFIPTLRLFIPTIAVSVYTMLDKTLIGLLVQGQILVEDETGNLVLKNISDIENGYYEQAEKIVKLGMTVFTSFGSVMIPKNSRAVMSGDMNDLKHNLDTSLSFASFLGFPLMLGLIATCQNFCPWFFGEGYEKVPFLIMMFSPLVMIIGYSNILGLQCLLPIKRDSKYTISIISGSIVNLVLNLCLIPFMRSYGACIATIFAEFFVTFFMFHFSKDLVSFKNILIKSWKNIFASIIMFGVVYGLSYLLTSSIYNTLLLFIVGVIIYFSICLLMKDSMTLFVLNKAIMLIKKILRKKNG